MDKTQQADFSASELQRASRLNAEIERMINAFEAIRPHLGAIQAFDDLARRGYSIDQAIAYAETGEVLWKDVVTDLSPMDKSRTVPCLLHQDRYAFRENGKGVVAVSKKADIE